MVYAASVLTVWSCVAHVCALAHFPGLCLCCAHTRLFLLPCCQELRSEQLLSTLASLSPNGGALGPGAWGFQSETQVLLPLYFFVPEMESKALLGTCGVEKTILLLKAK